MAGVCIKGMEMPKFCEACCIADWGYDCCPVAGRKEIRITYTSGRPDFCPLEEVPDHGDLIDRNLLEEDCEWDEREDGYVGYSRLQIQGVSAVICADKEEA